MRGLEELTAADVDEVYQTELLGPSGQSDLTHYETRLKEAFDEDSYTVAMKILAESAIQGVFTPRARHRLEEDCTPILENVQDRIVEAIEVLEHDGYLVAKTDGHCFSSRLLRDWWAARFRDHHTPLDPGNGTQDSREPSQ